jgi:hypothetical protein
VPTTTYESVERVKPSRTGWYDVTDPAYDTKYWTSEKDELLRRTMLETDHGRLNQFDQVAALHFPDRRGRDIRMRWNTWVKPRSLLVDAEQKTALNMKKRARGSLVLLNGRYCRIPGGGKECIEERRGMPSALEICTEQMKLAWEESKKRMEGKQFSDGWMSKTGVLRMEQVEWNQSEDCVLVESFELLGPQWARIAKSLNLTRRSPAECRERLEQLYS